VARLPRAGEVDLSLSLLLPGLVLIAHWCVILGLSARVITRRVPVGVSLAWLAVIFSVPFVGAFVYLLIGEKRLGRERARRMMAGRVALARWQRALGPVASAPEVPALGRPLAKLVESTLGSPHLWDNAIELLQDAPSFYERLIADIDGAAETVQLSFYIWHEGGLTDQVLEALLRARERGVRVRALMDAMGSKRFLAGAAPDRLRAAGVEVAAALPTGPFSTLAARLDLRNHRKIVVVDDRIAFTGSQNLADPRCFKQQVGVGPWVDAMVRIEGPAALALAGVFAFDWSVETGTDPRPPPQDSAAPGARAAGCVQVVPSGPGLHPETIHQVLLTAIYAARRELVLTTPYFVPDDAMLTALLSAAMRGVAVTLIVPAHNDSRLVRYAGVAHFDALLAAGVRIACFEGGLLHTKSLVVDEALSIFGSVNFDNRSLWLNFEITLLIHDPDFSSRLRALQDDYLAASSWLELDRWRARPGIRQFLESSCRLLAPLL
jgi:cardiolipin synthase